jgi:hypothetical protein
VRSTFAHVLLVTLPEATPIHEGMQLERDLARVDSKPPFDATAGRLGTLLSEPEARVE